jgi:hypothetical protein
VVDFTPSVLHRLSQVCQRLDHTHFLGCEVVRWDEVVRGIGEALG